MNDELKSKKKDEIFCPECGKPIKRNAVICPHCGVQIKELEVKSNISVKSKSVSVVLAIFFSFFSWLYTYGRNRLKFWICLVVTVIVYMSGIVNDWPGAVYLVINGYIWLYSIIDNSSKSYKFYSDYPNG
jgi:uncharacterized membrane protein YqaE (UPF0057 family)